MRYGTLTSLFSAATVALIGLINVLQPSPGVMAAAATGVSDSISTPLHAIRIWHLTDVHFNLWHDRRGNVRDMCRTAAADASLHPGKFGHFNCDPDFAAVELAVARMTEAEPAPDMILFGGDVFGHVPLLFNPVFADYMQAYGAGGMKAGRLDAAELPARSVLHAAREASAAAVRHHDSRQTRRRTQPFWGKQPPRRKLS
jgi:2',3'-cyclic-nucleotide 2'-phosphodiesterase (5'-nucleotidase family)